MHLKLKALLYFSHPIARNGQFGSLFVLQANDQPAAKPGAYFFDISKVQQRLASYH
jgi:hypothetical protein